MTIARRSRTSRSASTAPSALASWTKPRSAFRSTIAAIAAASIRSPISAETSGGTDQKPHERIGELAKRDRTEGGPAGARELIRSEPS